MNSTKKHALQRYIELLTTGEAVPLPKGAVPLADIAERIHVEGRIVEVNEETYWWFLEVLPPRWMDHHVFCFAEGAEQFRLFWQQGSRYFCRKLTWNETHALCQLVGIHRDYFLY